MNRLFIIMLFASSLFAQPALAEIYRHVDANGNVTYSNVKIKGGKKLDLEPADTNFGNDSVGKTDKPSAKPAAKTATPSDFPKVDSGTQKQRDNTRRDILRAELDGEKAALEKAKQAYAEGESNPEVYRTQNGKIMRNMVKFDEKMKTLREAVEAHERNIQLLEKELASLG